MASVYRKRSTWYARFKDAAGRWTAHATTAATKADARRLAEDLQRKAERQRFGLDPLPSDSGMTLAGLCAWWLANYCPAPSRSRAEACLRRHAVETPLGALPLAIVTAGRIEEHLRGLERHGRASARGLAPASVNHVRAYLRTAFNRARRAGVWTAPNPAADTEARKVPKRAYQTLAAEEVPAMLAHVPEDWRGFFAAAAYLALRKGECAGLLKTDAVLERGLLTVRASYDRDTTKGKHADVLPIPPPLAPYVAAGLLTPGPYLFPAPDGSMRSPESDPERILRRALGRAGIVVGYEHRCRRCQARGKPHVERHPDPAPRRCASCGMALWPVALPRRLRFQDLRHSAATILLRAGVDAHRVQRILRHASVTTTTGTYAHLLAEDLRPALAAAWAHGSSRGAEATMRAGARTAPIGSTDPAPLVTRLLPDPGEAESPPKGGAPNVPAFVANSTMRRAGIEPATLGLKGRCSAN